MAEKRKQIRKESMMLKTYKSFSRPAKSFTSASTGGLIGVCLVWTMTQYGIDMPGEVGAAFGALSVLVVNRIFSLIGG